MCPDQETVTGSHNDMAEQGAETTITETITTTDTTKASNASVEAAKAIDAAKDTAAEKTAEKGAEKPTDPPPGPPESYADFKLPENVSFQPEVLTEFQSYAKAQGWTQEQAQANVDFFTAKVAPQMQAAQLKSWEKQVEGWTKESEKLHGKDGIEAANKALGRFSTPELVKYLADTGLGNHPDMIAAFKKINAAISESTFVDGQKKAPDTDYYPGVPKGAQLRK